MTIPVLLSNDAGTVLALPLASGGTSATLYSGAGALFPNPGAGQYFPLTLISASNPATIEIVYCTACSGDVVTIARAQEGTTALAWNAGDLVNNQITAGIIEDIESRFALLAGSSSQVFNVANAVTATEAVALGQAQALFAPMPILPAGVGQWQIMPIVAGTSGTLTLPAGGTWLWFAFNGSPSGANLGQGWSGINAGGTVCISATGAGALYGTLCGAIANACGWCWRIA